MPTPKNLKVHLKTTQSKLWNREKHNNRTFRRRFLAKTTDLQVNNESVDGTGNVRGKSLACKFIHNVRLGVSSLSRTRDSGVYISPVTITPWPVSLDEYYWSRFVQDFTHTKLLHWSSIASQGAGSQLLLFTSYVNDKALCKFPDSSSITFTVRKSQTHC